MSCRVIIVVGAVASITFRVPAPAQDEAVPPAAPAAAEKAGPRPADAEAQVRSTLKAFAKALQDGDRGGIVTVLYAANPTEMKMVDAMAGMAVEMAGLYKASAKAFGDEQAKGLTGDLAAEASRIDDAVISIDGDAATVRYAAPATAPSTKPASATSPPPDAPPADGEAAAPAPPLVLKRVDGRWRVPMAELSKDTTPDEIEQRLGDLDTQRKVIAELSGEIAKGKYKSAEKAAEAWQAKMMQALTPRGKKDAEPAKDKPAAEKTK